ncbi:MAG: Tap, RNA-binding, partial [Paramarteilia canceri]
NANRNNSINMNTNQRPKNNNFSNYSHKNTSFNPNNQRNLVNKKKNVLLANENNINKNLKTKNTGLPENRWFKVNIYKGKLFNREFVLKSLKTLCENNQFIVYQYHEIGNNSAFFVQGENTARTLFECNSKIVTSNGERIKLQIVQVTEPLSSPITKELSIKIQELVDNNLDQSSLKLELDYLSRNPIFLIDEIYISLNKPIVISTICEALKSKSETVQHLSLRGNSLYTISAIKKLLSCLPNLKKLDLSDNNLLSLNELSHLKDLCGSITEINLRGNPLNDKPSEDNDYIKYVRSYLSRIIILDSVEHPPPILFDFNESLIETKLPESNNEFFIDSSIKDSVIKFLDQYIYIYDSDDRQPLLEAYDDNASFSLSLFKSTGASNRQQQNE